MSRIFLSHSSVDELEAVALKEWLAANGWDDVFLDIDPQRGLAAGERWQTLGSDERKRPARLRPPAQLGRNVTHCAIRGIR